MKKLILMLGVVALGTIAMQSCSKKTDCVCTDKAGNSTTIDLSVLSGTGSTSSLCNTYDTQWKIDGGSCKLK